MQRPSLQELKLKVDAAVNEVDHDDLEDEHIRQFIEHHLLSLSLGAHIDQELISQNCTSRVDQLKYQRDLVVYEKIEGAIGQRLNQFSTKDLYGQLLECKAILDGNIQKNIT
jgi:hypothetical protein